MTKRDTMAGYSKKVLLGVSHCIRQRENIILLVYAAGVLAFIAAVNMSVSVPCVFKLLFDIPCPGCGLYRAGVMLSQLDFVNALQMNIMLLPLLLVGAMHIMCALIDALSNNGAVARFNAFLAKKWVIAAAVLLMSASWYYNIIRGV